MESTIGVKEALERLQNGCSSDRAWGAEELAKHGNKAFQYAPDILRCLRRERSGAVMIEIVRALGDIGNPVAISNLQELAESSLALEVKKEINAAMAKLAETNKSTPELVDRLYSRAQNATKVAIIDILSVRKDETEAMQALLGAVRHRSAEVRLAAVGAIKSIQPKGWVEVFTTGLSKKRELSDIRSLMAWALAGAESNECQLAGLTAILTMDTDPEGRTKAAIEMSTRGLTKGVPALLARLRVEQDRAVARNIVRALGKLGDASLVAGIKRCRMAKEIEADIEEAVNLLMMSKLETDQLLAVWDQHMNDYDLIAHKAMLLLVGRGIQTVLIQAVSVSSSLARKYAVRCLTGSVDPDVVEAIIKQLTQEDDTEVREMLLGAIPQANPDYVTRANIAFHTSVLMTGSEGWEKEEESARALVSMGTREAILALINCLNNNTIDYSAQEQILQGLKSSYESLAPEEWIGLLDSELLELREIAARLLSEHGVAKAVQPIIKNMKEADPDGREAYLAALVRLGHEDQQVLDELECMLNDPHDWSRRNRAGKALSFSKSAEVANLLVKRLGVEDDFEVVETIIRALDKNGNMSDEALEMIRVKRDDDYDNVCSAAREVFKKYHQAKASASA